MKQLSLLEGSSFSELFDERGVVDDGSSSSSVSSGEGRDPDGLRWYQRDGYAKTLDALSRERSALVVMATGLGKSRLVCTVAKHWNGPVLLSAHRDELVRQLAVELEAVTGELVEIEQGDLKCSAKARLVVASTPTLAQQHRLDRLGKHRFGLHINDEAHHGLAPTYRRMLEYFDGPLLGCTATPDRTDERALAQLYDEVAYCFDIVDGIDAGYLVPIEAFNVNLVEIDLSEVDPGRGEGGLNIGQLDEAMKKSVEGVVQKTLELHPRRKAIAFWPGVASAEAAAHRFNHFQPGSTAFVCGATPPEERRQIMADFKRGKYIRLSNCQIATEGFDCPDVDCIIGARPTLSRALGAQMAGRGTRVLPGTVDHVLGRDRADERKALIAASGKPKMTLLNFVGNAGRHQLVGPEDILGGAFEDAEVKLAKKKLESRGGDVRSALEEARRELREMAKRQAGRVKATVDRFDPFSVLGMDPEDEAKYSRRFGWQPITAGQFERLEKMKVPKEWLKSASKREASRLIQEAVRRRDARLCTFAQMAQLNKYGVTDRNITFERAGAAMNYLQSRGWGRRGKIDPSALWSILQHHREPGSDG